MEDKIIVAFRDNRKDMLKARKCDDYEEEAWCRGYEQAIRFVMGLLDISYEDALSKKIKGSKPLKG